MRIGIYLEVVLHLVLLGFSLEYCWFTIVDYSAGKTSYSLEEEPLSLQDLPTITVCLQLLCEQPNIGYHLCKPDSKYPQGVYGKHLVINAKVLDGEMITLLANQSMQISPNLFLGLSEIHQTWKRDRQCFKISPQWNGTNVTDLLSFSIEYLFRTKNNGSLIYSSVLEPEIYVTSEDNSYGLVTNRWYDGKVPEPLLPKGAFSFERKYQQLEITEVLQYDNLNFLCSQESYYKCLARRFAETKPEASENCSQVSLCSPCTLPAIRNIVIPLCKTEEEKKCYQNVLMELKTDQDKHCLKLCQVKEFKTNRYITNLNKGVLAPYLHGLDIKFVLPKSVTDHRSEKVYKIVKKEYLVVPWTTLVGNVGGTLGMFIGFSFVGFSDWILRYASKLLKFIKKIPNNVKLQREYQ